MDKLCQFYIILGSSDFKGKNDGNVYINATGANDVNLIKKAVYNAFHKKRDERVPIANHIIFLIPSDAYKEQSIKIMDELNLAGRIEYLPQESKVVEPVITEEKEIADSKEEAVSVEENVVKDKVEKDEVPLVEKEVMDEKLHEGDTLVKREESLKDNVYHGEIDNSLIKRDVRKDEMMDKDSATYMGYNPTLINNNVKKMVRTPEKKSGAFITLPVIIFILSFILLVVSIIILFVLD